jgi:hypothetical protein
MVTSLRVSALTRLKAFHLGFDLSLAMRIVLPALTTLWFDGTSRSEYLEDLIAFINAPLLEFLRIYFVYQQ